MKSAARGAAFGRGRVRILFLSGGRIVGETPWSENTIALNDGHGMNLIQQHHRGDVTYPLEITHLRFGTGTSPRTAMMTDLETPYATYFSKTNQIIDTAGATTFEFFVPSADLPNGTYTEAGIYCGAQYYASALLVPELDKGTNVDALVQYQLTYSTT